MTVNLATIPEKTMQQGLELPVAVEDGDVSFFLDDKLLATRPYESHRLDGLVGLYVQDSEIEFSSVRMRY